MKVDVVIPVENTGHYWKECLDSFYREIPINRLLIGDGGCTDKTIEIAKQYPNITFFGHSKFKTLGYSIRKLVENVETEWFVYLHSDVLLPKDWFKEMVKHCGKWDWFECSRIGVYPDGTKRELKGQFQASRAYSGSQMGKTKVLKQVVAFIEDDFVQRTEDIIIQQKLESLGYKYGKTLSTSHFHFLKKDKWTVSEQIKIATQTAKAEIKYLSPTKENIATVQANLRKLSELGLYNEQEWEEWTRKTNPLWVKYIKERNRKKLLKNVVKNFIPKKFIKSVIIGKPVGSQLKDGRVSFKVNQVVGDGASENLPAFSSRIYYETSAMRKFLKDLHVERSLEIGCGYARLTPWIAECSDEHYGVEPEKELYLIAKKLYPSFRIFNVAAEKMPFPDKYFSLIVSWTVLQHIPPEKFYGSIKEILRVARDDAIILIAEYTKDTPSPITWGRSIGEYSELLKPFILTEHEPRKVESSIGAYVGEVMKFERKQHNSRNFRCC